MDSKLYICSICKETLDSDSLYEHPCFADIDGDKIVLESTFVEDGQEEDIEEKVEYVEEPTYVEKSPKFRVKVTSGGRRGDWSETDVHRLLDIYIKNYKELPKQRRLHSHYLWNRVMRDLKPYGNFSRFLVQAKIKKLKKAGRSIVEHGNESKWPYLSQVLEILQMEDEHGPMQGEGDDGFEAETEHNDTVSEDENEEQVAGLRRWTVKETRHLIQIYKKHLPKYFTSIEPRKIAWDDIIADLGYGLATRYTMYQIRARIRNAQNTYRHIVENKRKKPVTHWPLFMDLADLAKSERELASMYGVPIGSYRWGGPEDPDIVVAEKLGKSASMLNINHIGSSADMSADEQGMPVRWNVEETKELILSYKKLLPALLCAASNEVKKGVWEEIANEVNAIRRRKITFPVAQAKIEALRDLWQNHENGHTAEDLTPVFDEMKNLMKREKELGLESPANVAQPSTSKSATKRPQIRPAQTVFPDESSISSKRKKKSCSFPQWYLQYQKSAQQRHDEKMEVQERIISLFERLIEKAENLS